MTPNAIPSLEVASTRRSLGDTSLKKFFQTAAKHGASDLIIRGDTVPRLRLRGKLVALETDPISAQDMHKSIMESLTEPQHDMLNRFGSVDIGCDFDTPVGNRRFRINVFRTRGRLGLAARLIGDNISDFEELFLPAVCRTIAEKTHGLVLMCGITGSGKSTTLASMINHVNRTRPCHIVTLEDPIEYLFHDQKAVVSQRELGIDVPDFPTGLKALVREDPDVVLIGEMRDRDTFEAALQAAETGHLVFGTIHASSSSQAFGRIYDLFVPEERPAIRNMLAFHIQAFIYQRLLPSIKEGLERVPAVEILLQSPSTRKYILEGRENELEKVIRSNRDGGMQSLNDSLVQLVNDSLIHPREAMMAANAPEELKMRLRGIENTEA